MNFYAIDPASTAAEDPHEVLSDAWRALDLARDLWALVDSERAAALRAFQERESHDLPSQFRIGPRQIRELLALLDRLEPMLSTRILDAEQKLPADQLDELARKAPALDLSPERPVVERVYAAEEALSNVLVLQAFLQRALQRGDDIIGG
jgi:hypothetical protein